MLTSEGERHSQRSGMTACSQNMGKREALRQMHKLNAGWIDLRDPDDHRALTLCTRETDHHRAIEGSFLKEIILTAFKIPPFCTSPLLCREDRITIRNCTMLATEVDFTVLQTGARLTGP